MKDKEFKLEAYTDTNWIGYMVDKWLARIQSSNSRDMSTALAKNILL